MFGSNNYLGLTTHTRVREAAARAAQRWGTSLTGSRFVNGTLELHEQLERRIAAFVGKPAALVFTSGYQVNLAVGAALLAAEDAVAVIDRQVHASIYDGVRLGMAGGGRWVRFRHNTPTSLDRALARLSPEQRPLVITDGVFSAEGTLAPLDEFAAVARRHGARLFVDDAHGLGVVGPGGRGTAAHFGVTDGVDLIGGTFSKSLASVGGFLAGDPEVLDYVRHFAPSFMFAASATPASLAAALAALDVLDDEGWRVDRVRTQAQRFASELHAMGFDVGGAERGASAIVPVRIGDGARTLEFWNRLMDAHGVYTNPFLPPGVPERGSLLRTSCMATHEPEHLDRALEAFAEVGRGLGLIA
jgi:7-keto-8-aminopelargonate synthetase-like enzyme